MTLTEAAGVEVEPIWATLLAKALEGKNVKELLSNVGAGGGAPAAVAPSGGATGGGPAGPADEPKEEEKEEEKEESDDDMVCFFMLSRSLRCVLMSLRALVSSINFAFSSLATATYLSSFYSNQNVFETRSKRCVNGRNQLTKSLDMRRYSSTVL